ncbi:hypothetical protein DFS34DRAFT_648151 [Phlyctochytrium arcticum]|nr:hypothetical protein DFS34DRAFT_648151 [Phlyctochytrium arcticum]
MSLLFTGQETGLCPYDTILALVTPVQILPSRLAPSFTKSIGTPQRRTPYPDQRKPLPLEYDSGYRQESRHRLQERSTTTSKFCQSVLRHVLLNHLERHTCEDPSTPGRYPHIKVIRLGDTDNYGISSFQETKALHHFKHIQDHHRAIVLRKEDLLFRTACTAQKESEHTIYGAPWNTVRRKEFFDYAASAALQGIEDFEERIFEFRGGRFMEHREYRL